ncbi:phage protein NinX family protein [Geoalkalibacter subterraneus]|uniref:Uncharacterized protein n=1 Tax=Geoalkalibacter subterraneus TaxID=483547 RepID=A0A0B5FUE1_9BACT|nr:phage protein NinX family protein [Geoalkalibacter subterraneus]AJF08264.1 hypothetical protein GSUB_17455 [Geoalkalibacter subterraneus]
MTEIPEQEYLLIEVDLLSGTALDWAVAITNKMNPSVHRLSGSCSVIVPFEGGLNASFCPSSRWSDGGPLIEGGKISLRSEGPNDEGWYAVTATGTKAFNTCDCFDAGGDTALEAAMRCYVKKFGAETVEVPEILVSLG